ncbi:MFS transporter [Amycolatopsis thermophila]|uniref:MFS family permease n=1 Tax=Amycolatopsis thermophila TaxID=206084 RepID=A0ABU0F2M8_9PSEU|nr:MFS transporter [Amycolatopsis thermophila]MDQ0381653.1 MFS family permease [Amycolatopsis thermophila]
MTSDVRTLPTGFGRLWTAQTISSLGDGVTHAALPLLALTLTREPMPLAVVTAAGTLPWLLFGVLGGALVDRWDRRRTTWVADAARAVLLAIPAAAAVLDVPSIPLLAGGRAVPLLADAVSFMLSALLVRTLPVMPRPVPEVRESLLRQARAGASYVFRNRVLLGLALRPAVGNVAFLAVETVLALFARDRLGIDTYGFGLLLTAEATGGLLGAGVASYLGRRLGTGTALTCTAAVEGLAILGLAASPNPYAAGLALAVCGAGMGATMVLGPPSARRSSRPTSWAGTPPPPACWPCAPPPSAPSSAAGWPAPSTSARRSTPPRSSSWR